MQVRTRRQQPAPTTLLGRARQRLHSFFTEEIWSSDTDQLGWPLGPTYQVLRILQLAWRGILANRALFTASALTFTTVLSLVPMLAFAFSVAKGMGAYQRLREGIIEPFLESNLGVSGADAPEAIVSLRAAIENVLELVSNTNVSSLGAAGLVVLVLAVIRVLGNVEDSFNKIWGVRRARSLVRRISDYLSLSVITPLLLVLALGATAAVQNNAFVDYLLSKPLLATLVQGVFGLGPLLSIWLGFTLLYILLPNTQVRIFSALLGGFVGGTMWHLAQVGHVKFQIFMANYNAIYSSFAAIPIFLVWIYVSWVTVMFGAELAHAHQYVGTHRRHILYHPQTQRSREILALRACVRIADHFLRGQAPWELEELANDLEVTPLAVDDVLTPLVDAELLVAGDDGMHVHYLPARDLEKIRVVDVLRGLRGEAGELRISGESTKDRVLLRHLGQFERDMTESRLNLDLATLTRNIQHAN